MKKPVKIIADMKKRGIFALSSNARAESTPLKNTGFFYAHNISGVVPPDSGYNGLNSPGKGLDTGKATPSFVA
jgi:hypothetical protein